MCYSNNTNDTNSVIDLFFLHPNSIEFDNHIIISELQYLSNYTLLIVNIFIVEEFIQDQCWTIIRNNKEEENFISELIKTLGNIDTLITPDKVFLKLIVQEYANILESIQYKFVQ